VNSFNSGSELKLRFNGVLTSKIQLSRFGVPKYKSLTRDSSVLRKLRFAKEYKDEVGGKNRLTKSRVSEQGASIQVVSNEHLARGVATQGHDPGGGTPRAGHAEMQPLRGD
jgi:hypothetical protein